MEIIGKIKKWADSFICLVFVLTSLNVFAQNVRNAHGRESDARLGQVNNSQSERFERRVNVGGRRYMDSYGNEWLPDHIYRSGFGYMGMGGTFETTNQISGTENQKIYQSERYQLFGYRFDVPNGHYEIILHFAEIYHKSSGKRLINIEIEDLLVEKHLDIVERVGPNAALKLVYNTKDLGIPIRDERIDIKFTNIKDDTKLSGIEVIQLMEQPTLLRFHPESLDFGADRNDMVLQIENIGATPASWSIEQLSLPKWIRLPIVVDKKLEPGDITSVKLNISRSALSGGIYQDEIIFLANDIKVKLPARVLIAGASDIEIHTKELNFEKGSRNLPLIFSNAGGKPVAWSINADRLPSWVLRIYPNQGRTEIGDSVYANVTVDRSMLAAANHQTMLPIRYQGGSKTVSLKISVPENKRRIIYVNSSASGLSHGKSWQNAFTRIKDAIQSVGHLTASERVEIWVAEGIYYEFDILVKSGIELYGGFRGDETTRLERDDVWSRPTIIDAGKRGRCLECQHRTVIDGFVIQNGRDWSSGDGKGAAVLLYENDVKIRNNLIRTNIDSWAGALFVEGDDPTKRVPGHSPMIEYNVLTGNFSNYCAAAIEVRATKATIRNNTIVNNIGYGLEINTVLSSVKELIYGDFYNNIITDNYRHQLKNDVWAEARKSTNYSYVGTQWDLRGDYPPYSHGIGNIFGDVAQNKPGFLDAENGDYRLKENSVCIDAGNPVKGKDEDGSRSDLGAFPFNKDRTDLRITPLRLDFGSKSRIETITLSANGGTSVHWRAAGFSNAGDCFIFEPREGVIKSGEKMNIHISVDRNRLNDGHYQGFFAVMTDEQSYEGTISFHVNNRQPEIELQKNLIEIDAEIQGDNPPAQRVMVFNNGFGNLIWKAEKKFNHDWLQIEKAAGRSRDEIVLHFDTSRLGFGEYHENIIVYPYNAKSRSVILPITLKMEPGKFVYEIEAEKSNKPPKTGWKISYNDGAECIQSTISSIEAPNLNTRMDYDFEVADGVEFIYVFAEIDVNQSRSNDSFWFMVNDSDPCLWDHVNYHTDGWSREWVYQKYRDEKHMFVVIPGKNTLNLFTRETGGYINWMVITNDPDIDIDSYRFGSGRLK